MIFFGYFSWVEVDVKGAVGALGQTKAVQLYVLSLVPSNR